MSTLAEIEAAAEALGPQEKEELFRFLAVRLQRRSAEAGEKARLVRENGDALLEASPGAPSMTPETVKRMLEDFP